MQRKDGDGGKEGREGTTTPRGKRETEKMSQSWRTEKWRERERTERTEIEGGGRRRKRAPSIPYLCHLKPF